MTGFTFAINILIEYLKNTTLKAIIMSIKLKEYQKKLLTSDSRDTGLQVGDTVDWVNDYGVEWRNKVIGFNYSMNYNKKYNCFVHLDTSCYWFPHNHEQLKKVN